MPMDDAPCSHSACSSPSFGIMKLRGLASRQWLNSILPLLLFGACHEYDYVVRRGKLAQAVHALAYRAADGVVAGKRAFRIDAAANLFGYGPEALYRLCGLAVEGRRGD